MRSTTSSPISPEMTLADACRQFLDRRSNNLAVRSHEAYRYHFRTLQRFFSPDQPLSAFHEGQVRDYQRWRIAAGVGASVITHEIGALAQILELADLWHPISRYYERLPEKSWAPPKILTREEEERFIRFGRRKPAWRTALNSA